MKTKTEKCEKFLGTFTNQFRKVIKNIIRAGDAICPLTGKGTEEVQSGESHRAVAGAGDARAQEIFGEELPEILPGAKILVEEPTNNKAFVSRENPEGILDGTGVVGDPLDGTTMFSANTGWWCVALGTIEDGIPRGSILYAPALNSGLLIASHHASGDCLRSMEWRGIIESRPKAPHAAELQKSVICFGTDTLQYPALAQMFCKLTGEARVVMVTPSGLLGLAFVALGRFGAVVQTPQRIWDVVPVLHALRVTGMDVWFYRINPETKRPCWMRELDYRAFCYARPNRVGLIAGNPSLVPYLKKKLDISGRLEKVNPSLKD